MSYKGQSQQNLPLKFADGEDKFGVLNWVEANGAENQRFDFRLPPYAIEDTIYTFANFNSKATIGVCGYDIKKINRSTGDIYWNYQVTNLPFLQRRALSQISYDNDKLSVVLFKEIPDMFLPTNRSWSNCVPAQINIDLNSGNVIDSFEVDFQAGSTFRLFNQISSGNEIDIEPSIFKVENGYQYLRFIPGFKFVRFNLNHQGQLIDSITIDASIKYGFDEIKVLAFGDTLLGKILISGTQNWMDREIRYKLMDRNLNIIKDIDLAPFVTDSTKTINLLHYSHDYFILVTGYEDLELGTNTVRYHMFDKEGNFIEKAVYVLRDGIDNGIVYGWFYPMVDIINRRILLTRMRQDMLTESTYFDLFVSDSDTLKLIKRSYVEGNIDHFRVKYGTMLDNGDLMLYIEQFVSNDPAAARWYSWIMLDGQKMNIISSTNDIGIDENQLKIHPNPTNSIVHIQGLQEEANVRIQHINGQVIKTVTTTDGQVDISGLPNGLFIFEIQYKQVIERHKVLKVE